MSSLPSAARRAIAASVVLLSLVSLTACRSTTPDARDATTTTADASPGTVTTLPPDEADTTLFTASDGLLIAISAADPEESQVISVNTRVDPADPTSTSQDLRVHDQACFFSDGTRRFLMPVEPGTAGIETPTWGVFQLTGDRVGSFKVDLITTLGAPSFQAAASSGSPHPYGCASLSDGRMVTTDLGSTTAGEATGQLTVWFPPFDGTTPVTACKIDVGLAQPQGVWVDDQDRVHVASPQAPTAGVWRYSRLPTSADAAGGCGALDPVGAPLADAGRRQPFIAAGDHGLQGPSGIALSPTGELFVSSPGNGVINGYDVNGDFFESVLAPPAGETPGTGESFSSGTPMGLAVDAVGTLYFADPAWVLGSGTEPVSIPQSGLIQSVEVLSGAVMTPRTVFQGLTGPTNVTVFDLGGGSSGSVL